MRIRRSVPALALLTVALTAPPTAAADGNQEGPALYREARLDLADADTVAALAALNELTREQPDFAPGWGLLGAVLTRRAAIGARVFRTRQDAESALRRALDLDPANPLYLYTYALLKRKQHIYTDARRLFERATRLLEKRPDAMPPAERADLWYQWGRIYEEAYVDTRHLVYAPDVPVSSVGCGIASTFCENFVHPDHFNGYFRGAADLSEFGEDDFERMAHAFREALRAEPTHSAAFRRLEAHLVDRGAYAEAEEVARAYRTAAPESPWGHLMLGLIYQRTRRDSLAALAFEAAMERAPAGLAAHYRDIALILPERAAGAYRTGNDVARARLEAALWRRSDPLYLTGYNEVHVAHLARVAYADVMFEDPSQDLWGSKTERGQIYVRYGPPKRIWQLPRDATKEESGPAAASALEEGARHHADPLAFMTRVISVKGGGRWIFWNYGWDLPDFIFQKELRERHAVHQFGSNSKWTEERLRASGPAAYDAPFERVDYPVQVARFRGPADSIIDLDLYSAVPVAALNGTPHADSLQAGLFIHAGAEDVKVYSRVLSVPTGREQQALTYSVPLLEGRYSISLEARSPSGGAAAVEREEIEVTPFTTAPGLSDLLLGDAIRPRRAEPRGRLDYEMEVNRELAYDGGAPIAVYWEIYGLRPDRDGLARYRVTLSVEDAEKGVLAGVVDAIGKALGGGGGRGPRLSFERVVPWDGDRAPEYMVIRLTDEHPGAYRVRVRVSDLVAGAEREREREFVVRP